MNLGWLTPTTPEVEYRRVVLHEFGHALGLVHEHLSPAAEIPWDEKKVIAYYKRTNGWNEDYIRANVLARSKADAFTRFDPLSIMLYPVPKELTIGGFEIPWSNSELSALDREFIAQMYPFSDGRSSAAKAG
jgi:serralysin